MDMSDFDFNITSGEFTDTQNVTLIYGEQSYHIRAVVSRKYARKEVDGRYTTDLPLFTPSVTIAKSEIPQSIPVENLRLATVAVEGKAFSVRYITGTGFITLTLKPSDGSFDAAGEVNNTNNTGTTNLNTGDEEEV